MSHYPVLLKNRQILVWSCVLGGAGALTTGATQAQTRQPAPVLPVAPVVVAPTVIAIPGVGVGVAAVATPDAVKASAVLSQVQVGALTAQQAWESGQLTMDDLVRAANKVQFYSNKASVDEHLREALVRLLIEHGQDRWMPVAIELGAITKKPENERLNESTRLAVADSLSKARDERAVAVYEDILLPLERTRPSLRTVGALNHLGSFYWDQGKLQQAADVFLRGEKYSSSPEWAAAIRIDAARVYTQMGNAAKAKELYLQAARSPNGIHASMAVMEAFGRELQIDTKQTETQLLQITNGVNSSDAQLTAKILLAFISYKSQDWKGFLLRAKQVLRDYELIEERSRRQFLAPLILRIEDTSKWAKIWQTRSVVGENADLRLMFDKPLQQSIQRHILVNTYAPTELRVTIEGDNNRIKAHLEESPWASELQGTRYQKMVVVTIASGAPQIQSLIRIERVSQAENSLEIPIIVSPEKKLVSLR